MSQLRIPARVLAQLKSARAAAAMENASFGFPTDRVRIDLHLAASKELPLDEFIKTQTENYLRSWVLHPLDAAIAWAEGK